MFSVHINILIVKFIITMLTIFYSYNNNGIIILMSMVICFIIKITSNGDKSLIKI